MTIDLECKVCGYHPPLRTMRKFLDALEHHLEEMHPFELSVSEHGPKKMILVKKTARVPPRNGGNQSNELKIANER